MVGKEKIDLLAQRMKDLGILEIDLVERFILGSGHGGQKINKTSSSVYLKHIPTGIEVKCQSGRSQALNRYLARVLLCDKLEEVLLQKKSKAQQEREKIRRQKRRRSRKQKEKMLKEKKLRGQLKELRKLPATKE
ncbi:MAG: peptide chain release factor-like protein [Verrucomicrobiota bacterium]|nr:peptide chain release factor-like protein [Verrucomicrobiota bacterium]